MSGVQFEIWYKPLLLHILSELQGMSCLVNGGETLEQKTAPYIRKRVDLDQGEEKCVITKMRNLDTGVHIFPSKGKTHV